MSTNPAQRLEASIRLGIAVEEDWDGPSIKPGALADDQISWLAAWLAGDGCDKLPQPGEAQAKGAKVRPAIAEPVALRRHVGLTDEGGPLGALVEGFTEVLRRLGYAAGVRITPSPFGGWDVVVAVQPLSEPDSTVKA